jgi:hypothetical protein
MKVECPGTDIQRDEHGQVVTDNDGKPVLVPCPGGAGFDADEPTRTTAKMRWPEGTWEQPTNPADSLIHRRTGWPTIETLDIYECPHCGSPVAIAGETRNATDDELKDALGALFVEEAK